MTLRAKCWPLVAALVSIFCLLPSAFAANWYVRPSPYGAGSGNNWSNAASLSTIWGKTVAGGDTIWLAGGTHAGGIDVTKSGAAGNYLYIKRATGADSECTTADGWSASYDNQVVIGPASYHTLRFDTVYGGGSYTYWDGRTNCGIKLSYLDTADYNSAVAIARSGQPGGQKHVTFANVEMAGPYNGVFTIPNYQIGPMYVGGYYLSAGDYPSYFTFTNCWLHPGPGTCHGRWSSS